MKNLRYFFLLTSIVVGSGCSQTKDTASDRDAPLAKQLAFDASVFTDIRKHTDSALRVAEGDGEAEFGYKDPANYKAFQSKKVVGFSFDVSEDDALSILSDLHEKFNEAGYLIYISQANAGFGPDEITVLKTDDMFDALRFEGTNGVNHDIFTEDIIEKLQSWNDQFGLDIFAASFDLVQARYVTQPTMLVEHAEETYAFCPDVVDQGTGTLEVLVQQIEESGQLYLWWD